MTESRTEQLREVSGTVTYTDPLTSLFYSLLRDHLPAGVVEKLVNEVLEEPDEIVFTNGWLAKYANNLADQMRGAKTTKLSQTLGKMFEHDGSDPDQEYDLVPERPSFSSKKDIEEEMEAVREEIEEAANRDDMIQQAIAADEMERAGNSIVTIDDAKDIVKNMGAQGVLSSEKVKEIEEGLKELSKEVGSQDGRTPEPEDV